jgi:hypothetical protein
MRDYILPSPEIEDAAKLIDPEAWRSSDSQAGAFSLRYRRYRAREQAGWPNDLWPRKYMAPMTNQPAQAGDAAQVSQPIREAK